MTAVEFFFDCSSPWTYLAFEEIQRIGGPGELSITFRPILLGGVFNAVNSSHHQARLARVPAKESYLAKDLADWARRSGLQIVWKPSIFPINSVAAMRGCLVAARRDRLVAHARGEFEAYWCRDLDISHHDVLDAIRQRCGLERDEYFDGVAEPEIKLQLRRNTDELIERGGFGSPTFFVDGDDMYFGNDRLVLLRDVVAARAIIKRSAVVPIDRSVQQAPAIEEKRP